MTGNIQRRGENSWRIRFDLGTDPMTGERKRHTKTFRGTKREAEIELARLVTAAQKGALVNSSRITVSDFLDQWERDWATPNASPKTVERWSELLRLHVKAHVGHFPVQKLTEATLTELYARLLRAKPGGTGLSARTVKHVHSVLHDALKQAVKWRLVAFNVASGVTLPKTEDKEMNILDERQITATLQYLRTCNSPVRRAFYPVVSLAVTTGLRRGEIAGLRWKDIDLASGTLSVAQTVEQTKKSLRAKPPKSKAGRRTLTLAPFVIADLRAHRKTQQETRLALGLGKSADESTVFAAGDGRLIAPSYLTGVWRDVAETLGLKARLHDLRHTHASHLIASGMDIIKIQRRLGHSKPSTTLNYYGHLWGSGDEQAARTMEAAFSPRTE
jgi:integrase